MANPNLGQAAATTLQNFPDRVSDHITNHNALLAYLKKHGKIETREGGRTYVEPTLWQDVTNAKFYDGAMESFSIPIEDNVDASEWSRKFQAGFIYFTESERQSNRGEQAVVKLVKAKMDALKATLANAFSTAIYNDGTTSNEPVGLQAIVADDPTSGVVGGINSATYTWWQNLYKTDTTATASNIQTLMNGMWLSTLRGVDKPDLIVAGNDMFTYYWDSLTANQRYIDETSADTLNFQGLRYQTSMVLFDSTCATKRMYGLNTKDWTLVCDPGRKWAGGSHRDITNATYEVVPVLWSGALLTNRRASHFVIEGT